LKIEDKETNMNANDLKDRTKQFAHRCVKFALSMPNTLLGQHIASQIIRSSTSVAANYRAANLAQSKSAFTSKLSIALEESDESHFWVQFALDEKLTTENVVESLLKEADELTRIFAASRKTAQRR